MSADEELTGYLWPIAREMVKTTIENKQNLIIEGSYIPFGWKKDFDKHYLPDIKYVCLVQTLEMCRRYPSNKGENAIVVGAVYDRIS